MGLLSDFTAYVDSLKRRGANTARELVADPMGLLGRNVSAFSESLPAAPGEPQNEMLARPGLGDSLKRAAGLTARYAVEGAASLPGLVLNPLTVAAGRKPWTEALSGVLTSAGLPQPESPGEKVGGEISRGIAGGAPVAAGAQWASRAMRSAPSVVRAIAAAPVAEMASQGIGAGASQTVREAGGPEWAALMAGVVSPMAAQQGVAMNAPTMGLLGTTKPPLKPIGDGLFGDDVGNVFRKFSTPKNTLWAVGRIDDRGGWVPYAPELKFHESLDAARAGIRADKASARAFDAAQKYNAIPNNWTGESRKIAKKLVDNDVPIDAFAASSQSKSKYITLADGRKLRISNHDLPLGYDAPDIDFRLGGDVDYLIKQILERE